MFYRLQIVNKLFVKIIKMNSLQLSNSHGGLGAKAYLFAFVVSLFLVWSPSNELGYIAPVIAIALYIIISKNRTTLLRAFLLTIAYIALVLSYKLIYQDLIIQNAIIAFLTYSSFFVFVCIPSRDIRDPRLYRKMFDWIRWFVLAQAILGIVQAAYGFSQTGSFDISNGDFVEGTIHPFLAAERAFSNPMFATNMTFMLLAMLPVVLVEKKGRLIFILGVISLVLASVIHVLLFLGIAVIASVILFNPMRIRRRSHYLVAFGLIIGLGLSFIVLRQNFGNTFRFANSILKGESIRSEAIRRVFIDMPDEFQLMPVIGLGPGQFSSRAGLIGTGMFFGRPDNPKPIPLITPTMSDPFHEYSFDLWMEIIDFSLRGINLGSTHKPFLSWLSVISEFGILTMILIIIYTSWMLLYIKTRVRSYDRRLLAVSMGSSILLLILLGIQENYWEIPQAILIGVMLIKVQYSLLAGKSQLHGM